MKIMCDVSGLAMSSHVCGRDHSPVNAGRVETGGEMSLDLGSLLEMRSKFMDKLGNSAGVVHCISALHQCTLVLHQ